MYSLPGNLETLLAYHFVYLDIYSKMYNAIRSNYFLQGLNSVSILFKSNRSLLFPPSLQPVVILDNACRLNSLAATRTPSYRRLHTGCKIPARQSTFRLGTRWMSGAWTTASWTSWSVSWGVIRCPSSQLPVTHQPRHP